MGQCVSKPARYRRNENSNPPLPRDSPARPADGRGERRGGLGGKVTRSSSECHVTSNRLRSDIIFSSLTGSRRCWWGA